MGHQHRNNNIIKVRSVMHADDEDGMKTRMECFVYISDLGHSCLLPPLLVLVEVRNGPRMG